MTTLPLDFQVRLPQSEIVPVSPVIDICLRTALRNNEPFGVWGGMSPDERARLVSGIGA